MSKKLHLNKTFVWVTLVVLVVAGSLGYSAYLYQTNRKPTPTISANQALKERDQAVRTMNLHDAVNQRNLATANQATTDVQAKLTNACATIKTAKLVNPICQ